jgi:hypothetical protein
MECGIHIYDILQRKKPFNVPEAQSAFILITGQDPPAPVLCRIGIIADRIGQISDESCPPDGFPYQFCTGHPGYTPGGAPLKSIRETACNEHIHEAVRKQMAFQYGILYRFPQIFHCVIQIAFIIGVHTTFLSCCRLFIRPQQMLCYQV